MIDTVRPTKGFYCLPSVVNKVPSFEMTEQLVSEQVPRACGLSWSVVSLVDTDAGRAEAMD